MDDHAVQTHAQRTARIRELNDILRTRSEGGRILITPGVIALPPTILLQVLDAVRNFEAFTPSNDPHGEHDFGQVIAETGEAVMWKIDYYDTELEHGSPDPADHTVTQRVMTIFLASEY